MATLAGALLAFPATAGAEKVTIGNPLDHSANFALGACGPGCTAVQRTQEPTDGNNLPLTAPVNGVVTAWSVRTTFVGATFRLRILRPLSGLTYGFAGSSTASPAVPDATDSVRNYTASVPILQGQAIGLQALSGTGVPLHTGAPATNNDTYAYFPTDVGDGGTGLFTADPTASREVLVQATISFCRVPDLKGLKRADAVAALTAAECGVDAKKKKLKRTKKNRKRKGRVLRQLTDAGTTVAPGTPVELRVAGLKPKPKPKS